MARSEGDGTGIRMEQIYYTQCPIGYGLGASNGFQIKRLGPGYPASGDVRHLALRPFLPGSNGKQLAPGTLRYRRVDAVAEVAWLEPRPREYETERGQWGRPGGHFAHGLRLDPDEFDAIACWPAGLHDRPCWRRSDPEPSRGRRPEALAIGPDDLIVPPDFHHVAPLIDLPAETLASLLARLAEAARTGRTLFLIDHPQRLGPRIAALTFAFPSTLRAELTFSTYHDRPEELSGFRIHGTTPSPQLNRSLLASLGPVADLTADRFDAASPVPAWAATLATWLTRREPRDEEDWTRTDARARVARRPEDPAVLWSDAWLDGLIGLADAARSPVAHPADEDAWRGFSRQVDWAFQAALLAELSDPRSPSWWRPVARQGSKDASARVAFWTLLLAPETWSNASAADASRWGAIAAYFWVREHPVHREQRLKAIVQRVAPPGHLIRFLDALIRTCPPDLGQHALDWLERRSAVEPRVLFPLQAPNAVGLFRDHRRGEAIEQVVLQASAHEETFLTVLDLIADEATRLGLVAEVADLIARRLGEAEPQIRSRFEGWAFDRRERGQGDWIARPLLLTFSADLLRSETTDQLRADWNALRDRTAPDRLPMLAQAALEAASQPEVNPEAYPWAVERLVLDLPEADREGIAPQWAEDYVRRVGSPIDLAMRMRLAAPQLARWLDLAASRRPFAPEPATLRADAEVVTRIVEGQGALPDEAMLARVPAVDRPAMLELLIDRLADGHFDDCPPILDRCSRCWPGAFDPGADDLDRLADPLAELLLQFLPDPGLWIEALDRLLGWIRVDAARLENLRRSGIAAAIVARTCRITADHEAAMRLRAELIRHDRLYPTLEDDLAHELLALYPSQALQVSRRWVGVLDKGHFTDRFFEVLLNACDGPRLAVVVPEYAAELGTLRPLAWWSAPEPSEGPRDLREAFARTIPMAPLPSLTSRWYLEAWLSGRKPEPARDSIRDEHLPPLVPDAEPDDPSSPANPGAEPLSDRANIRWRCILALSEFLLVEAPTQRRWDELKRWRQASGAPPVDRLDPDDRYAFVAWLLQGLDRPENPLELEFFARWVARDLELRSRRRIEEGPDAIAASGQVVSSRWARLARDLAHQVGLQLDDRVTEP